ncbi:hypothetical protein GGI23_001022 [Coemansia sp. RSA 2559]|nr:hypothetical protein GGI23_001022 [Coemansia sp. RSA 2559]KAJ2868052.1 hypothetical protein GGI22_000915 [Coemansia erecta]
MFGFRKSKAKRSIRKRDDSATESGLENDDGPADVVKRNSKAATPRQESRTLGASSGTGLSFGADEDVHLTNMKMNRSNLHINDIVGEHVIQDEDTTRTYSHAEINVLKSGSERPDDGVSMDVDPEKGAASNQEATTVYPFAVEGVPNAQEIYMAKKLRRQRQAEQRMNDDDGENDEEMADIRESDDFIALSDEMASSRIRGTTRQELLDDGAVEGEDEMDTIIIGKNDRAEFDRNLRMAKEESIEHAQDEDEPSDWENEQMRNAGVASIVHGKFSNRTHTASLPKDTGNYRYDGSHLTFLLEQEKDQLALEEDRLRVAKERREQSSKALEDLTKQLAEAQVQWDHFSSLVRSL